MMPFDFGAQPPAILRPAPEGYVRKNGLLIRDRRAPLARGSMMVNPFLFGAVSQGNDANTKVLLHMDGSDASTTFTDSNAGGSAHTWTANGNAQIDTAQFRFPPSSGLFDGTGDYLTTPPSSDFDIHGAVDWTIDYRTRFAAAHNGTHVSRTIGASPFTGWYIRQTMTTPAANRLFLVTDDNTARLTSAGALSVDTWQHIAWVKSATTITLFIDGVADATTYVGNLQDPGASSLAIGRVLGTTTVDFNGWMDEFRLSNVARWTSNFTPPTTAYS